MLVGLHATGVVQDSLPAAAAATAVLLPLLPLLPLPQLLCFWTAAAHVRCGIVPLLPLLSLGVSHLFADVDAATDGVQTVCCNERLVAGQHLQEAQHSTGQWVWYWVTTAFG